jgi:hypothetical protein
MFTKVSDVKEKSTTLDDIVEGIIPYWELAAINESMTTQV